MSFPGILFVVVTKVACVGVLSVILGFLLERRVVSRERAAKMFRPSSYVLSKTIGDAPKTAFFNTQLSMILYLFVGLHVSAGAFVMFILVMVLTQSVAESAALALSARASDAQSAAAIIAMFVIMAVLIGGVFIESDNPDGWSAWPKYLSFVFYALLVVVFGGVHGLVFSPGR